MMLESGIKKQVCDWLEAQGFYTVLNVVTNRNGYPDVTVLCPGGGVFLIETKKPGKEMRALQNYRRDEIQRITGIKTYRIESLNQMKEIIKNGEYLPDKVQ